jgi:arogenate dehydrogenase (NADP+)
LDVLVLSVPITDFEKTVSSLPVNILKGKLVVEVCPLSIVPKQILLQYMGQDVDIICSTPMFGSDLSGWDGQPMIYEKVRILDERRAARFLSIFERARCQMVEMTAEQQDAHTADAEFVTHLTGRLLHGSLLPATPVMSKEYAALRNVAEMASGDTFDLFFGMFKYNERARMHMNRLRDNLAKIERQLAAKDAYIAASAELRNSDRQRLIAECRLLLQEVTKIEGTTKTDVN